MLDGTTRYRFVPNEGVATPDAFYGAFVANVLSDLIAVKG
jgi:uncharacterized BrkB/YihY/UPF0761 family membrane protein